MGEETAVRKQRRCSKTEQQAGKGMSSHRQRGRKEAEIRTHGYCKGSTLKNWAGCWRSPLVVCKLTSLASDWPQCKRDGYFRTTEIEFFSLKFIVTQNWLQLCIGLGDDEDDDADEHWK